MESQHANSNPWSFQQTQHESDEEELPLSFSKGLRFRRDSNDHRHYSYASSTTIAPDAFDDEDRALDISVDPFSNKHVQPSDVLLESPLDDVPSNPTLTESTALTITNVRVEGAGPEERNLSDSGVGLEGEVLGHLVQTLQSEVADTRAIVFDLESRLNAAESSNKYIVDELKMLLADAEGTLVGSDESDSGESVAVSSKHGSGIDEDSNVVYSRICHALQSLITEAQSALTHTNNGITTIPMPTDRRSCHHQQRHMRSRQLRLPGAEESSSAHDSFVVDDGESSQIDLYSHSSCRTSRRSSIAHSRTDKPLSNIAMSSVSSTSSTRLQAHSARNAFSRMLWKEKQLEQYERYRRSCDRVSLELEMLLNDTIGHQDLWVDYPASLPASIPLTSTSSAATTSLPYPPSEISTNDAASVQSSSSGLRAPSGRPRSGTTTSLDVERMQRSYQVQMLGPQARARQRLQQQRRDQGFQSVNQHGQTRSPDTITPPSHRPSPPSQHPRQFKSQGVGSSRPPNLFMQLYSLWKHTWLRRRMMHVLTESLEAVLILWVVIKLGEASLGWMGMQTLKVAAGSNNSSSGNSNGVIGGGPRSWLTYIYGDRKGPGAATAKELYERIRKDGKRIKKFRSWRRMESESSLKEFVEEALASEVATLGMARRPFTPSGMVWEPAGRLLAQVVSGAVVAYLTDYARRLTKKL
ncbi:hypothetical protein EDD21DRAFT_383820 [Dissophora ornata]|nr:hypothetical protein EDD21DRAFT_383820 [Dissophora ornata]